AYLPTPDHRYILELGMKGETLETPFANEGVVSHIEETANLNPYIKGIRIFDSRKQMMGNTSYEPDADLNARLDQVLRDRTSLRIDDPVSGEKATYLFVDLKDERYGSDVSRIIEITYDNTVIQDALTGLLLYHIGVAVIAFLVAVLFAIFLARRITAPIRRMAADVDALAGGDLEHPVSPARDRVKGVSWSRLFGREMRLSHSIFLSMVLIVGVVVFSVATADYLRAEADFHTTASLAQRATEGGMEQTVKLVDISYTIFDNTLNQEMRDGFVQFFNEYNRAGGDVSRMDLESVKQSLGGSMDLYVINDSLVVERTTFAPDLGLDFKQWDYTREYLQSILTKDGFYPDRIVRETTTGSFRKYAYMPTPDHRYIFELGLSGDLVTERHGKLQYADQILATAEQNPYLESVRLFDTTKHVVNNYSYVPTAAEVAALDAVIKDRQSLEISDSVGDRQIKYLFINLTNPAYASDMSWILKLDYNTSL
ncbi:MAG TPA: HAMP domain-containing protein, partial [Methanomicrobiales archaeon]|nr:HAMP domain-containing protein [Methanomicrobiales archaeon]